MVDDEDFDFLSRWRWHATKDGRTYYASRNAYNIGVGGYKNCRMHRFILERHGHNLSGLVVDHINSNGLDNRKENLRPCTFRQNGAHHRQIIGASSTYRGVSWSNNCNKWKVSLKSGGVGIHGGYFNSEKDAALRYNILAKEQYGEFAQINNVEYTK